MAGGQSGQPDMTTVHTVQGLLKAQVIKAKLESANIPVLLHYESLGPVMGITVDGVGEVHIQVPTRYADRAKALIQEQ